MNLTIGKLVGMKQAKLHIFGCSHSTGINSDEEGQTPWFRQIQNYYDLDLNYAVGAGGANSETIYYDISNQLMQGQINKDDWIIMNTSYPLRHGTPRLQITDNNVGVMIIPNDIPGVWSFRDFDNHNQVNKMKEWAQDHTSISHISSEYWAKEYNVIIQWYIQTWSCYKLLSSVCDNVYQWTLGDNKIDDYIYKMSLKEFSEIEEMSDNNLLGKDWPNERNIRPFHNFQIHFKDNEGRVKDKYMDSVYTNPWENLILPSAEYSCWNDLILANKNNEHDGHLSLNGHTVFANEMIKGINKIKDPSKYIL